MMIISMIFFFSSRRRHTRLQGDWSSDVCSSDLLPRSKRKGRLFGSHVPFHGHAQPAQVRDEVRVSAVDVMNRPDLGDARSEEHTSELQSPCNLVCRLLLEKKKQADTLGHCIPDT